MRKNLGRTYRVAIVEDHALQRARTEHLVGRELGCEIVFSGSSAPEFRLWLHSTPRHRRPHLLVLDLMVDRQPSVEVELVHWLLRGGVKIVVLSALASAQLVRAVARAGVSGIISKHDSEADTIAAIRAVLGGEEWMTADLAAIIAGDPERPELSIQEELALVLYASGLKLQEVAEDMNISTTTAKQYLERVKGKYSTVGVPVRSKHDFGRVAMAHGYIAPPTPESLTTPGPEATSRA